MNAKLKKQAKEIMLKAEESGVASNYFFLTTFERYQVQLGILEELEKAISEEDILVQKEYVKGRKNLYSNPAINEYNRTVDSANKTVSTLMKILKNFQMMEESDSEEDPLFEAINGSGEGDE